MIRVLDPPPSMLMAFTTPCSISSSANSCNVALWIGDNSNVKLAT